MADPDVRAVGELLGNEERYLANLQDKINHIQDKQRERAAEMRHHQPKYNDAATYRQEELKAAQENYKAALERYQAKREALGEAKYQEAIKAAPKNLTEAGANPSGPKAPPVPSLYDKANQSVKQVYQSDQYGNQTLVRTEYDIKSQGTTGVKISQQGTIGKKGEYQNEEGRASPFVGTKPGVYTPSQGPLAGQQVVIQEGRKAQTAGQLVQRLEGGPFSPASLNNPVQLQNKVFGIPIGETTEGSPFVYTAQPIDVKNEKGEVLYSSTVFTPNNDNRRPVGDNRLLLGSNPSGGLRDVESLAKKDYSKISDLTGISPETQRLFRVEAIKQSGNSFDNLLVEQFGITGSPLQDYLHLRNKITNEPNLIAFENFFRDVGESNEQFISTQVARLPLNKYGKAEVEGALNLFLVGPERLLSGGIKNIRENPEVIPVAYAGGAVLGYGTEVLQSSSAALAFETAESPVVVRSITSGLSKAADVLPTVVGGLFVAEQVPTVLAEKGFGNRAEKAGELAPVFVSFYEGTKVTQGLGENLFTNPVYAPVGKIGPEGIRDTVETRQFKPEIKQAVTDFLNDEGANTPQQSYLGRRGEVGGRSAQERAGAKTKAELRQRKAEQQQPFKLEKQQLAENEALFTLRGKGVERLIRRGEVVPTQALKTRTGEGTSLEVVQVKFQQGTGRVELTKDIVPQKQPVFDLKDVERSVPSRLRDQQAYTTIQEEKYNTILARQRTQQVQKLVNLFKEPAGNNEVGLIQPKNVLQERPVLEGRPRVPQSEYTTKTNVRTLYQEQNPNPAYLQRGTRSPREQAAYERLQRLGAQRGQQIKEQLPVIDRTIKGIPTEQERNTEITFVEEPAGRSIEETRQRKKRGFLAGQFSELSNKQGNDFRVTLINLQGTKQEQRPGIVQAQSNEQAQESALSFSLEQQPLLAQDLLQEQEQLSEQATEQITAQQTVFQLKPITEAPSKPPQEPVVREPRPEEPRSPFRETARPFEPRLRVPEEEEAVTSSFGLGGRKKRKGLYDVEVRRFNKFYRANAQGLRIEEAFGLGESIAQNTLAASFQIKPVGSGVAVEGSDRALVSSLVNKNTFGYSKKNANIIVEKPSQRLSTIGERTEIRAAKESASIFGGSSKRSPFVV